MVTDHYQTPAHCEYEHRTTLVVKILAFDGYQCLKLYHARSVLIHYAFFYLLLFEHVLTVGFQEYTVRSQTFLYSSCVWSGTYYF